MLNVREVAGKARRLIGDPTYDSVSREVGYEIVWNEQQSLINHTRRSHYALLTKTIAVTVGGDAEDYVLPDDFGGVYVATYDPQFYTDRALPEIEIVSGTGLDQIDEEAGPSITPGRLRGLAIRFDAERGQNLLIARPRNRSAYVLLEYTPGLWREGTPSDRVVAVPAFQSTLLVRGVALQMLQLARWDGLSEEESAAKARRFMDQQNPRSLSVAYDNDFRQFDHFLHSPNTRGTSYSARGWGYTRR